MARHEHLPIYKAALDMTVHFEKLVAGFSRYHKYTLGTELREGSRAVLQHVLRGNLDSGERPVWSGGGGRPLLAESSQRTAQIRRHKPAFRRRSWTRTEGAP